MPIGMYSGCDTLSLRILFVYFLALPSLLHPSILLNCFLYLYKKITVAIMNTCHVNGIQCIIEGILRFEDPSKNCVKRNMNMYIIHKLYTAFQKKRDSGVCLIIKIDGLVRSANYEKS